MTTKPHPNAFEDRYRLYIDESGDHVFRAIAEPAHRFLCLLGCWFKNSDYLKFHHTLEALKARHLAHHPDEPIVLHREDIINARGGFRALREPQRRQAFDADLLHMVREAEFRWTAVVIDKVALREQSGDAAFHPYHLGLGFLLQAYASFLNEIHGTGDVMAESRGGAEDRELKDFYATMYAHGLMGGASAQTLQAALTSKELKLKKKAENIAGLQLADVLAHPVRQWIVGNKALLDRDTFAAQLLLVVKEKLAPSTPMTGDGYVLYP